MMMLVAALSLSIPNSMMAATAVLVCSFFPVIGSAPVTLGYAVYEFAATGSGHGFAMLIVAALIMTADNLVRPLFLKGTANLHPLIAFVGAFGGLEIFGFPGVFLGPIIAGLFIATLQILSES
jgi:predicted PurR-regulated permease PerM